MRITIGTILFIVFGFSMAQAKLFSSDLMNKCRGGVDGLGVYEYKVDGGTERQVVPCAKTNCIVCGRDIVCGKLKSTRLKEGDELFISQYCQKISAEVQRTGIDCGNPASTMLNDKVAKQDKYLKGQKTFDFKNIKSEKTWNIDDKTGKFNMIGKNGERIHFVPNAETFRRHGIPGGLPSAKYPEIKSTKLMIEFDKEFEKFSPHLQSFNISKTTVGGIRVGARGEFKSCMDKTNDYIQKRITKAMGLKNYLSQMVQTIELNKDCKLPSDRPEVNGLDDDSILGSASR